MGAFIDAATGCQIARALRKVLRGKAPHLRGRKPAECGVGRESDYVVTGGEVRPEAVRCRWDAEAKELVREAMPPLAQAAEVSPLDTARLAAWGASLRHEASIALPMDQYRAALEHYFAERVWRDPSEQPHLYGVRLAAKVA